MKKTLFTVLALSLILLSACVDPVSEPEPDYRDQWTGYYRCNVSGNHSIGTGEGSEGSYTDTMMVSLTADSSLMVSSLTRNRAWTFKVDESGKVLSGRIKFGPWCSGAFSKGKFYFSYMDGGPNVVRRYEVEGRRIR